MSDAIIIAIITAIIGPTIVAVISYFSIRTQNKKHRQESDDKFNTFQADVRTDIKAEMQVAYAVMNNEIKHLTDEVRKHNNFAEKIPVMQKEIEDIQKDIDGIKDKLNQV